MSTTYRGSREDKRSKRSRKKRKHALDPSAQYNMAFCRSSGFNTPSEEPVNYILPLSKKVIESREAGILDTDEKEALRVQAALQAAIVVLVTVSLFDGNTRKAEKFTQDLVQKVTKKQLKRQHVNVQNSQVVTMEHDHAQTAFHIQILLEVLLAIAVMVDIL